MRTANGWRLTGWQVVASYEDSDLSGYDKRVVRGSALKTVMATTG